MEFFSTARDLNVTLVTVCLEPQHAEAALAAAERYGWTLQTAQFDHYISPRRRPHFGSELRHAENAVALVDFDVDPAAAAEATAYLHQAFNERMLVVALSSDNAPDAILAAMRAGCAEYAFKDGSGDVMEDAFSRITEQFALRQFADHSDGSILAFFGAKGGVGSTTLAVHLATFLTGQKKKKILLIDNHLQFGHVCVYLGLDGAEFHFQELVRNVSRMDSELLRGFVAKHSSGVDVLSSPDVGKAARPMHPDDVASALEFLRGEYDFVLVDCAAKLDDVNRVVIGAATHVYVVATPEISAVRDLSRYVDDLVQLEDARDKVRVILNRYSSQFAISLDKVEKAIRLPIHACITNSYVELVRAGNLGEPVPPSSTSPFSVEIQRWANDLVGVTRQASTSEDKKGANSWKLLKGTLSGLLAHTPTPTPQGGRA